MNKADSTYLAKGLDELGCTRVETPEDADIVVVNSCVVRQSAENRVISRLDSLKEIRATRPSAILALTGCMVDSDAFSLKRRFPHVDMFLPPGDFWPLLALVAGGDSPFPRPRDPLPLPPTAYVNIIEGCDNFCTYCIVPYRRGRERSRPASEIMEEVAGLAQRGVREVSLLGQNVDSYGHDLPGGPDLAGLLETVNSTSGLSRLRFLTSHPKDMSSSLIRAIAALDKVCEYVSLPVQSGDDDILRAMGRGYHSAHYRELVASIRESVPGVAISTDVIVGFPGETEPQYERTLRLLDELRFDTVHVAAYSPRPGTRASRELNDDVPQAEKRRRLKEVEALQRGIASGINSRLVGSTVDVLVERKTKGRWEGRTRTNRLVFFDSSQDCTGRMVSIRIEESSPWFLRGRRAPSEDEAG